MENVAQFAAVGRAYGVEGLLNTGWGDGGHRNTLGVSMHGFGHGAAHGLGGNEARAGHPRAAGGAAMRARRIAQLADATRDVAHLFRQARLLSPHRKSHTAHRNPRAAMA